MPLNELPSVDLKKEIKPAGEASRAGRKTFCVTGSTGHGKTFSKTTIPKGMKALDLDFDGKNEVVSVLRPDDVFVVDLKFSLDDYLHQRALLDEVYKNAIDLAKEYEFCFCDGLTNMHELGKRISHDEVSGGNQYKLNYDKMNYVDDWLFRRLQKLGAAFKYFVLFCHEDYRETANGTHRVLPLARKAISSAIPANFQEVYHAATEGLGDSTKHYWLTRPEELYGNTSSITDLPFKVPNHFGLLLETDWSAKRTLKEHIQSYEESPNGMPITRWE